MSQELEVLKIVTKRLKNANIPYMITGSVAANFYAVPRMTRDIDEMQLGDVKNLLGTVKNLDLAYLKKWAESFGLKEVYQKVKDE